MDVLIDQALCKGCGICIYFCPRDVIRLSGQPNRKGYLVAEVSDPAACVGCRLCEIACPDLAIYLRETAPAPAP